MQQRDYIMRMVQQMTLALVKLIGVLPGMNSINFQIKMMEINDELVKTIGISISDIIEMEDDVIIEKIKSIGDDNIDYLANLLANICFKIHENKKTKDYDISSLVDKSLVLINIVEHRSETFSMEKLVLKSKLRKLY